MVGFVLAENFVEPSDIVLSHGNRKAHAVAECLAEPNTSFGRYTLHDVICGIIRQTDVMRQFSAALESRIAQHEFERVVWVTPIDVWYCPQRKAIQPQESYVFDKRLNQLVGTSEAKLSW